VPLKLRGTNAGAAKFEEAATTENVSMSGFLCVCTAMLAVGALLEVYLTNPVEKYVGKARIVHSDSQGTKVRRYGCVFTDKSGPWVLQ